MLRAKRDEFVRLFREFAQTYSQTPDGQRHLVAYESGREQGHRNFEEIAAAAERGEDVADRVLLQLIPYRDSPGYRDKGAWIHIAPATGDPRARTKAAMPEDWKNSAEAILRLVRRSEEHPDQLAEACQEFSESPYSKGFQAGLITPILNAVRPDEFLLANGKSVTVINHFSGTAFGPKLVDYPDLNSTGHALIAETAGDMRELGVAEIQDADLFDMFSHWLVGVKKYFDKDESEPPPTQAVLSWLRNLRTQTSPDGRFHYKPLTLLALLDLLDAEPEHPNSFRYEELLAAFEERAAELGTSFAEDQFSQPYLRMRNDVSPLQVWIPQTDGVAEIDDSRADRPAYVRRHAPSVRIDDSVWLCFSSPDGRAAIRQEIDGIWGPRGRGEQAPWFKSLEHPLGLETELQLILENSKRKEQDLLAAIFRRAILLHQRHNTAGFLGAQRKISQRFSIMIGNVYACAAASNGRETLYLLVDDDATLRQTYEVGEAPFSKNELMWIHGRLDRSSLRSLLEDETVWSAYGRMLPKVTGFPHARSSQYKWGRLDVLTGERYLSAISETSYWWVNQGQNYAVERRAGVLWARKAQQDGRVLDHHRNLTRLLPGHAIVHYAKGEVRAIGEVLEKAKETARSASNLPPQPPDHEGFLVRVRYHELADPIPLEEIPLEWRAAGEGPFTRQGSVKQIYLSPLSPEFAERFKEHFGERLPAFLGQPVPSNNDWLFQANPEQWSLEENLRTAQTGDEDDWAVTRYRKEMRPGDKVILWQAGPNAGAYALGELSSHPFERERPPYRPAASDGSGTEWAIRFRYTEIPRSPIPRGGLLEHPVLGSLQVLQNARGTNFKVTGDQWEALRALLDETDPPPDYVEPPLDDILAAIRNEGMNIGERTLRRYHLGLKSRGFVILTGVSGTGKTWLTEAYARAVGAEYLLVSVAPNWTTNEDLLGYFNPLDNRYHDTQFSRFLRAAAREYQRAQNDGLVPKPHHLILDEMNLARVEYYFAKFLSAMEVRSRDGTARIELGPGEEIVLAPNLRFAGTVNVDETTHNFADKVYDRAQLLELEVSREALRDHLGEVPYRETLIGVWDVAHPVAPFAFRVLDEIAAYVSAAEGLGVPWQEALDEQLLQKVLPKLKGADPRIGEALEWLAELTSGDFPLSNAKTQEMLDQVRQHGFASYF